MEYIVKAVEKSKRKKEVFGNLIIDKVAKTYQILSQTDVMKIWNVYPESISFFTTLYDDRGERLFENDSVIVSCCGKKNTGKIIWNKGEWFVETTKKDESASLKELIKRKEVSIWKHK